MNAAPLPISDVRSVSPFSIDFQLMKTFTYSIPVLALVLASGCAKHGSEEGGSLVALAPAKVQLQTLHAQQVPVLSEVSGTVRPIDRAMLAAKVMGVVAELPVTLGQRVKAGDPLLRINAAEIAARVAQAKSQLNLAQRDLERERDLLQKQASTAEMVRSLEDRYNMTLEMVKEAEVMLSYTVLKAPFDGVVSRKMTNAGDLAAPGMPLLEVEGTDRFELEANVPESLALRLVVGDEAEVRIAASSQAFKARIAEIAPSSDAFARNVLVKFSVPASASVRSGQYARITLATDSQKLLLSPASSVSVLGQMERIFVVKDGRAVLRLVKTGAHRGELVEILSGLADGEQVVVQVPAGLVEGQSLEVKP
jgi:RND family efflux transporter MFP subunit